VLLPGRIADAELADTTGLSSLFALPSEGRAWAIVLLEALGLRQAVLGRKPRLAQWSQLCMEEGLRRVVKSRVAETRTPGPCGPCLGSGVWRMDLVPAELFPLQFAERFGSGAPSWRAAVPAARLPVLG